MFGIAPTRESQVTVEKQWAAFEAEAMPHATSIFRIALWLTRDQTEAEDLVQETLTEALASFHRFVRGTNCRAWLVSIMYHRHSKRRKATTAMTIVRAAATTPAAPKRPGVAGRSTIASSPRSNTSVRPAAQSNWK